MKRMIAAAAVLSSVLVGGGMSQTAQAADVGDGNVTCNRGEICFYEYAKTEKSTKQFWYSASHRNYNWFERVPTNRTILNDIWRVANRDTVCSVKVIDDRGWFADGVHKIEPTPSTKRMVKLNDAVRQRNDRHERC